MESQSFTPTPKDKKKSPFVRGLAAGTLAGMATGGTVVGVAMHSSTPEASTPPSR